MSTYHDILMAVCVGHCLSYSCYAVANDAISPNDTAPISALLSTKEPISFDTPLKKDIPIKPTGNPASATSNTPLPSQLSVDTAPSVTVATNDDIDDPSQAAQTSTTLQLEEAIDAAIKSKAWTQLEGLLVLYKQQSDYDALLYYYALGGVYRSQMRHSQAIQAYQKIVDAEPELYYPRFDLGVMLFENKQYQQAKQEIQHARMGLDPQLQQIADYYLQQIDERQQWHSDLTAHYAATDNVNNASSKKVIHWGGKQWNKTEDSLPQSAHGIRYGADTSRDINLSGNHFWHIDGGIEGTYYWDNSDYSEYSIHLGTGYKYQDIKTTLSVTPFVEKNWLGGDSYSQLLGVSAYSSYLLNERWRATASLGHYQKDYQSSSLAKKYDGQLLSTSGSLIYSVTPSWLIYGGLNWSDDKTKAAESASIKRGLSLGTTKLMENGLGTRFNVQYAKRAFKEAGTSVYPFVRQDNEYRIQGELWHNRLSYKGLVPHLNVNYVNIDSNMEGFYSRDELQWLISLQKGF